MATSSSKKETGKQDTTTAGQPQKSTSSPSRKGKEPANEQNKGKTITPMYSLSPDVSPDFERRVQTFVNEANTSLLAKLARTALGDEQSTPFASSREGDTITISVPLTMARGDALAELILLIAAQIPTAVLHECTTGWVEPQWTSETSRQLMGFVSAVQGVPDSFASSSSPVDLTRVAVWITACNSALSQPGGVEGAVGSVLPTEVGGAKSANKYLTKAFGALRAVSSEPMHQAAVATLERLLRLWIKEQRDASIALVRKQKISWGHVLLTASPTETKKVKGQSITQIKSPSKPSRSPFLSGKEKQELSSLLAAEWNVPEAMRADWVLLSASEQHTHYQDTIKRLKQHYENINKLSTSIHAKLGHRKKWIHAACEERGVAPTSKKDKANEFIWSQNFFKLNLTASNLAVDLVFAPNHYLTQDKYSCDDILTRLWSLDKVLTPGDVTEEICGVTVGLWKEWALRFEPDLSIDRAEIPQAVSLEDPNPFADLPDPDGS